jgi:hypothetical protein
MKNIVSEGDKWIRDKENPSERLPENYNYRPI